MFPGELEIDTYLLLNLGAVATFGAIGGICFFFSCLFNETKGAAAFGAGIPVLFFVIDMLSGVSPRLDFLRNLTLFTLYDTKAIVTGMSPWLGIAALAGVAVVTYSAGIWYFQKKDLPI
jgi:ABC-2 type transport system permease protein